MSRPLLVSLLLLCAAATARGQFLHEKPYRIEAVKVDGKAEDRAYRVMRNAIARAPYHARQVTEYGAGVYMKGTVEVKKVSRAVRAMLGEDAKNVKAGSTFTEESWNEIAYTAPDRYDHRVVKTVSSMPGGDVDEGLEEGAMRLVNINIYDLGMIGNFIISPLSPGAFSHYRFRYEGYAEDRGHIINKIRVTPRRRSQQLVSGHIFIAEGSWSVHGLDISGHMRIMAGIDYRLRSAYTEALPDVWMPASHRIDLDAALLNSRATVRYLASVSYTRVVENAALRKPGTQTAPPQTAAAPAPPKAAPLPADEKRLSNRGAYREARRSVREMDRERRSRLDVTEEFTDRYKVTVDTLARVADPAFWDSLRPVALEPAELAGYRARAVAATAARDTAAAPQRTPLAMKVLMGTRPFKLPGRGGEVRWHGFVPSRGGFNTVDGYYFGLAPVTYRKSFGGGGTSAVPHADSAANILRGVNTHSGKVTLTVTPEVAWAIGRHTAMWNVRAELTYANSRRGRLELAAGSESRDFSAREGGIHAMENTLASLFFRRNYMKLYEDNFVEAQNSIDLAHGLSLILAGKLSRRCGLENTSDHSFFYRRERQYTPNFGLADHTAAIFSAALEYTPRLKYRLSGGRKVAVRSAWPTFFAEWRKGVRGVWGGTAEFDHLSGGVRQSLSPGLGQWMSYSVRAGGFTNRRELHFPDFHHFATADIPLTNRSISAGGTFHLLPYYRHSTEGAYLEAHMNYRARYLLLKLLPWFSDRLWMEGLNVGYMRTARMPNYTELGYTIGLVAQAGVFVGFEGVKYRSFGVKLSIPIKMNRTGVSIGL